MSDTLGPRPTRSSNKTGAGVRFGSKAAARQKLRRVCYSPESCRESRRAPRLLRATSGLHYVRFNRPSVSRAIAAGASSGMANTQLTLISQST